MSFFRSRRERAAGKEAPRVTTDAPAVPMTDNRSLANRDAFCPLLKVHGLKYTIKGDRGELVSLSYGGGDFSFDDLTVYVDFDPNSHMDGSTASIVALGMGRFSPDSRSLGLRTCDELRHQYRFSRAFLNDEGRVAIQADVWNPEDPAIVYHTLQSVVALCDKTYPTFQRAIWF